MSLALVQNEDGSFNHQLIALKPIDGGFEMRRVRFTTDESEVKHALYALVEQYTEKYGDYRFISADTLSPITFDSTVQFASVVSGRAINSDYWSVSFNGLQARLEHAKGQESYLSHSQAFCRTLGSRSGRAGDFLRSFDDVLKDHLTPSVVAKHPELDTVSLYFENRR
ncbi:hypothetical protein NTE19_003324 [Vibrio fluvialis]|nr:hypothetical protein [Vibrio fluvialis]